MPRFFVKNEQIDDDVIKIIGDDVNHISNVLRHKVNDNLEICNSENGQNYNTSIVEINKEYVLCKIESVNNGGSETNINVTLFQGLPKADKMEYIIQKNVEIGIKKIIPVEMERCIVKLDDKNSKKKIERWQKISEVAAKQSGRDIIPEIGEVLNLKNVCENIGNYDIVLVAYEGEKENTLKEEIKRFKAFKKSNIAVLIGPEGGIDGKEITELKNNGAKIITLGNRILRTETASLVILSNIIYELEM